MLRNKYIACLFRFNALWLAAFYYASPLFLLGVSFFIHTFFIYVHFSGTQLRRKISAACNTSCHDKLRISTITSVSISGFRAMIWNGSLPVTEQESSHVALWHMRRVAPAQSCSVIWQISSSISLQYSCKMEVALLEYIRHLTSQKTAAFRRKSKVIRGWKVWQTSYMGEGEKELRETWNVCCIIPCREGWGWGGYEEGRWVTWPTREWRVPSEWLNVNACSASTGGFYTVHCFTPPTTRTYHGLEKRGGVVLKFISTGIGAVTPMWRDAENRCIASHTMGFSTLVIQNE